MPRYYLQLRDHAEETLDLEGVECADGEALAAVVLFNARDVIAGDAKRGVVDLGFRIDAEDEAGKLAHSLLFTDAVKLLRAA